MAPSIVRIVCVCVCVCVCVSSTSWYVRDRYTSRTEPVGPNTGRRPQTTPWGHCLFWLGPYYPRPMRPGLCDESIFLRVPAPTYVFPPSRPGYPVRNIEAAALRFRRLIIFVCSLITSAYVGASRFRRGTSHIAQVGILLRSYL